MCIDTNFTGEPGDRELNAYNAAFYELGLRWHWDSATYEALLSLGGDGPTRVRHYLQTQQPQLLRAQRPSHQAQERLAAQKARRPPLRRFPRRPARP